MKILNEPLHGLGWFDDALSMIDEGEARLSVSGVADSGKLHMISALSEATDVSLVLTYSDVRAGQFAEEYRFFDRNSCRYPAKDLIFYQADINGGQMQGERLGVMRKLIAGEKVTIFTTLDALLERCIPLSIIEEHILKISKGGLLEERAAEILLTEMGYTRTGGTVEVPGEFSVRGGIIDIFDATGTVPYRIELWGDEVESIRSFDVNSQRSIEELEEVTVFPARELILDREKKGDGYAAIREEMETAIKEFMDAMKPEEASRLKVRLGELENALLHDIGSINYDSYINYFYDETISLLDILAKRKHCIFIDEPDRTVEHGNLTVQEFEESMKNRLKAGYVTKGQTDILYSVNDTMHRLAKDNTVQLSDMEPLSPLFENETHEFVNIVTLAPYNNSFHALVSNLKKMRDEGYRVVILSGSRSRAKRLADDLGYEDVICAYTERTDVPLKPREIMTVYGHVQKGFTYPGLKFTVIAETDIFGARQKGVKKKKAKYSPGKRLRDLSELHVGDYVINEDCGVGIYRGIEEVEVEYIRKDYMKIEYRDGAFLYVPATDFDKVSLFADKDAKKPKLNKLGTEEWHHTREKAKRAVDAIAQELVDLYAERMQSNGYCYSTDSVWQQEFEEMFPYDETEDQLNAIDAVKADMESSKIMDRLICGDVGFGKTEVAIRAAFKAVQENKQVAYLVPTTILAEQHYTTFTDRMKGYPVRIEMISRFRTAGEIKKVIAALKAGEVDIVIGTHRLLSKDVQYADLGLLIIDEEQRFGVSHKEKIKQLKKNVDVLTLTATPIPRTLHMSLTGIRDMSLLEEAPQNRQPIQTYLSEYNDEMVRDAINRELNRGGQVYYVSNRVKTITDVAAEVQMLVPNARVSFAHGQMSENSLEDIMLSFIHHEIDVLVSTTIIETGLDIPNVNTIIIRDSDKLGLSQLYQLRGRVGRSDRTAYAFLMYDRNRILRETAEKRLSAIRQYTELGSGFKIAMSDLEIRGAGNVLGKAQHGQVEAIGYDLYCKMLEGAVLEKRGIEIEKKVDCEIELKVDAYLPAEYIPDEMQKLDIYKRIAGIRSEADREDICDELEDRFGKIPPQADNLLKVSTLKEKGCRKYITRISGREGHITFRMERNAPVDVAEIPIFLNSFDGDLRLKTVGDPIFTLVYNDSSESGPHGSALMLEMADKVLNGFDSILKKERKESR